MADETNDDTPETPEAPSTPEPVAAPAADAAPAELISGADLPDNARKYLDFIAEFLGVPVVLASVGPKRDQTAMG